ncbi:YidC/Oxa1 family insertase periplasmic-domain containing protein [Blattabacterium cuenoti]|uniref:YidC/Oxa1 family insertase periplasmic-domain containing protein n=1 Tax=Blattabacterium cuenoti TaxID=1653831 RepID=UPI00163C5160|nr:YidC/Oxa1 family insertase periplasmic-domain containing protein [Blattabacterium cuenoti]
MKDKSLDYNSIIGLFLILFVLTVFTYFFNDKEKEEINEKKNFFKSNEKNFFLKKENVEKKNFSFLENNVLKLKISNVGGGIDEVLLKKYRAYNSLLSYHTKNLFLVKNSSFLYKMSFSNEKDIINTENLLFKSFVFNNEKKGIKILLMRAKSPYGKGFLDYVYTIGKNNQYDIGFYIRTINFFPFKKLISIKIDQKLISLEKDRNWENSYTQAYFSKNSKSIEYLSEKKTEEKYLPGINWFAYKQQFFASIFKPEKILKNIFIKSNNLSSGKFLKKIQFKTLIKKNKDEEFNFSFRFYFGPLDFNLLKKYKNGFENIIPFGWGFLKWINKYFFLIIFQFLEKTNLNYGIIIIFMTIVVKLILSPITYKQYKLSAIMKLIRPEIEKLNKKYENKKDTFKKQKAMMELYKKIGINPMSGCISTLIQVPIFYSLFKFFPTIINLRGKSFLWVEDLTSYDSIFELPFFIPFYGNHVSLLTLLYSLALLIYTKLSNNEKKNPSEIENSPISNMNFILYLMPIMMLLFINSYASALSLYYFVSNVINICFLFFIKKFMLDEKKIIVRIQDKKINDI